MLWSCSRPSGRTAPGPAVARAMSASGNFGLRSAYQQAVCFLIGVAELGVAEARQKGEVANHRHQLLIPRRKLRRRARRRVSPRAGAGAREGNAAELGEHERHIGSGVPFRSELPVPGAVPV